MKHLFIIANWKANITTLEAKDWLQGLKINDLGLTNEKEIVVCPRFSLLSEMKGIIEEKAMPISLGSQNISQFEQGAYTGEEPASLVSEFAKFCIIGHSERRKNFGETDEIVAAKIEQAVKNGLMPVVCISNKDQISNFKYPISNSQLIIAYEPLSAIGTGNPDLPENAEQMAKEIREKFANASILYGGSVTAKNVASFTKMEHIDGVLVGKASLDPIEFAQIIHNA